ncbi:methyltransferase domain-containing protein [Cohnella suwonensis]|uniref:Methyltransferase domain-containing protein n=1 Tax=Cohnella suwonensis TaxID=696072 RepID=A0ABW0M122_9BACL
MNNEFKAVIPEYPQTGVASTCRSYEEYVAMFGLTEKTIGTGPVLDVAGGASSFVARLNAKGVPAIAADPYYEGMTEDVIAAAREEIVTSSAKIAAMAGNFDWSFYGSPAAHRSMRENSLELFAAHFREDRTKYVAASLPRLPFEDGTFALATCSHFLFLYAESFGQAFHAEAIAELLRVLKPGGELRIYPLVSLRWEPCAFLDDMLEELKGLADAEFLPTELPFTPVRSRVLRLAKKRS